jgi:hypothetical protein
MTEAWGLAGEQSWRSSSSSLTHLFEISEAWSFSEQGIEQLKRVTKRAFNEKISILRCWRERVGPDTRWLSIWDFVPGLITRYPEIHAFLETQDDVERMNI